MLILLKPFDENMLLARIASILENRRRFQQRFSIDMNADSLELAEENSGDKKFLERAIRVVKENYKNPDFEVGDFINEMGISKSLLNREDAVPDRPVCRAIHSELPSEPGA